MLIPHHVALVAEPVDALVRPDDAELDVQALPLLRRAVEGRGHGGAIFRVDGPEEVLQGAHDGPPFQAEQSMQTFIRRMPVGQHVPVPGAHATANRAAPQT